MKEIVVIRLSSLGDVAMLVPVFLSFHQAYPDLKIRLITREGFAPIFADLYFVSIHAIDSGQSKLSLGKLIHFAIQLSFSKPKFLLDLHDVLRTKVLRNFCRLFGSKVSIIDKGRAEKKALIAMNGDKSMVLKTTFQRYVDVFQNAGFPFELQSIFLNKTEIKDHKKRIGISPFAKHASKEYSFINTKLVIEKLANHLDFEITIFGKGDREANIAKDLSASSPNVKINIDTMNLTEELKLISSLDLMVSMDSGNGHLAANYGIPVLTIWGTTHPKLGFGAYSQPLTNSLFPDERIYPQLPVSVFGQNIPQDYERAIDSINVEDIYVKILQILH